MSSSYLRISDRGRVENMFGSITTGPDNPLTSNLKQIGAKSTSLRIFED